MPALVAVCRGPTRTRLTTSNQQVRAHDEFHLPAACWYFDRLPKDAGNPWAL